MKQIGIYLAIAGLGSILLNLFGYEFSILMWIDNWGETVGWAIRGSAIVVGVALFFLGNTGATEPESESSQEV